MDIRKLKTILELFEHSNLREMEFTEGEEKIRLSKDTAHTSASVATPPPHSTAHSPPAASAPTAPPPPAAAENAPAPAADEEAGQVVRSPMVGTFYRSPSPDKPPYAKVGQRVSEGDTLCIIEAMKLMNELPSPVSGVVKKIIPEDGDPIPYDTPLFIIE